MTWDQLQTLADDVCGTGNGASPQEASALLTKAVPTEDGAALLDKVRAFIARFVSFPSTAALVAVTLWVAHAHLIRALENSPRLAILSPEPGSGKTRVLEILELLTPDPMMVLSASSPAIFRSLKDSQFTLLFDEVDTIFG